MLKMFALVHHLHAVITRSIRCFQLQLFGRRTPRAAIWRYNGRGTDFNGHRPAWRAILLRAGRCFTKFRRWHHFSVETSNKFYDETVGVIHQLKSAGESLARVMLLHVLLCVASTVQNK